MRLEKRTISIRGKIVMVVVALVGAVYWLIGTIEVLFATLQESQERKRNME